MWKVLQQLKHFKVIVFFKSLLEYLYFLTAFFNSQRVFTLHKKPTVIFSNLFKPNITKSVLFFYIYKKWYVTVKRAGNSIKLQTWLKISSFYPQNQSSAVSVILFIVSLQIRRDSEAFITKLQSNLITMNNLKIFLYNYANNFSSVVCI